MGIFDRIQQRLELFRLEQRYTRNRNRRTTFRSYATYDDGEYVYNTPHNTGSSTSTTASRAVPALHASVAPAPTYASHPNLTGPLSSYDDSVVDNRINPVASFSVSSSASSPPNPTNYTATVAAAHKQPKRWSAMPGFGSTSTPSELPSSWRTSPPELQRNR